MIFQKAAESSHNLRTCFPCSFEPDVWVTSEDPERNDILRLEEMKSRKSMLINTY